MGAKYNIYAKGVNNGTDKTILTLIGGTSGRVSLYDILIGASVAPADQAAHFAIKRFTAVGTEGSGFTPAPLDPADVASNADGGVGTFSVEPTYTAAKELLGISLNQRASNRWIAAPDGELIIPATANNGLGLRSLSSTAVFATDACIHFEE